MSGGLVEDLRDLLARSQVLVVAGAGVTAAATGRHPLGSWPGLLGSGVDWCEEFVPGLPGPWA